MDAELRKQPATDERANDSNDEIADDPKSGALHDLAGQAGRPLERGNYKYAAI